MKAIAVIPGYTDFAAAFQHHGSDEIKSC